MKKRKKRASKADKKLSARARKRIEALQGKRDPSQKAKDVKGTSLKLLKEFSPFKVGFLMIVLGAVCSTLFTILGPDYLGRGITILQQQIGEKLGGHEMDFAPLIRIIIFLIVVYTVSCIGTYIQNYVVAGITQKVGFNLRKRVNEKLSTLPLSYFDSSSKGDVLSRVTNDVDNICVTLQNNVAQIVIAIVTIFGVLFMMLRLNFTLTVICLFTLPICALIAAMIARRSQHHFKRQWSSTGELNGHIEEMYTGHKLVKVFGKQDAAIEEFDEINDELFRSSRRAQFISGLIMPLNDVVNNIGYVLICVVGGIFVLGGRIELGAITAFITYSKLFTHPISNVSNIINQIQSAIASAERVFSLLEEEDAVPVTPAVEFVGTEGSVEFQGVSFSYLPEKPLIENMNLTVKPGQTVAIVGPTGAGKTTIVNLVMRFYELTAGKILIGGKDITKATRENLRSLFGMVLQDTWLFKGTIRDNIAYGKQDATQDEIVEAAKLARANHFIKTLSEGYDTVLDEEGSNVSQGQRQLITIARALLADPKILILDEATSSVDTRTELLIQKAMKHLMKGRTSFVIAHRLSTIREADVILVMKDGQIVESGKHQELLEKKGFYHKLYRSQFSS